MVEHRDALQLRDFIKIEIVSDNFAFVKLGQFNQFQIDLADSGKSSSQSYLHRSNLCSRCRMSRPRRRAIALERIAEFRYQLQFTQNKLRSHNHAIKEPVSAMSQCVHQ